MAARHGVGKDRWLRSGGIDGWGHGRSTRSSCPTIENWFAQLTKKWLVCSAFTSVAQLVEAIEEWTSHGNDHPRPFVWAKPANDIIGKVQRGPAALTHQTNSATHH